VRAPVDEKPERKPMRVVIKIGGSLIKEAPGIVDRLIKEFGSGNSKIPDEGCASEGLPLSILIVPGGGIFADTVREVDEDPLPHTWDVTSDTIAAWVAKQTGAVLIKATDVDGIFRNGKIVREISAASCTGNLASCIDPALPEFLWKNRMECLIVNGKSSDRVIQAVYGKPVLGTVVKGNI
jgi:aspartokinase-like uncharacterized kinase